MAIFSITELVIDVFQNEEADEMAELARLVNEKLMEFANDPEYRQPEDREVIIRCIGKMIKARRLAVEREDSDHYRKRMLFSELCDVK